MTQLGNEVEVMVLEIDEERRRISLGMKHAEPVVELQLIKRATG